MKKQLTDVQESQSKGDTKLNKVLQSLRNLQDEKGSLEAKLGQKSVALQAQVSDEEVLHTSLTVKIYKNVIIYILKCRNALSFL